MNRFVIETIFVFIFTDICDPLLDTARRIRNAAKILDQQQCDILKLVGQFHRVFRIRNNWN